MKPNLDGRYELGVFLVTVSAILWSLSGILIRVIETDVWSTLFYRGVLSAVTISAFIAFRDGLKGFSVSGFSSGPT